MGLYGLVLDSCPIVSECQAKLLSNTEAVAVTSQD
jgi:hypothetical protein